MKRSIQIHLATWQLTPFIAEKKYWSAPDVDLNRDLKMRHLHFLCFTLIIDYTE